MLKNVTTCLPINGSSKVGNVNKTFYGYNAIPSDQFVNLIKQILLFRKFNFPATSRRNDGAGHVLASLPKAKEVCGVCPRDEAKLKRCLTVTQFTTLRCRAAPICQ